MLLKKLLDFNMKKDTLKCKDIKTWLLCMYCKKQLFFLYVY